MSLTIAVAMSGANWQLVSSDKFQIWKKKTPLEDSTSFLSTRETRHLHTQTDLWFHVEKLHSGLGHMVISLGNSAVSSD